MCAYIEGEWMFCLSFLEPSFSLTNLTTLLENVNQGYSREWWRIGIWFDIPTSKLDTIKGQYPGPDQRSHACWDLYITDHPSPTWKRVAYALYVTDHHEELEVVQKKYLKGEYKFNDQLITVASMFVCFVVNNASCNE